MIDPTMADNIDNHTGYSGNYVPLGFQVGFAYSLLSVNDTCHAKGQNNVRRCSFNKRTSS